MSDFARGGHIEAIGRPFSMSVMQVTTSSSRTSKVGEGGGVGVGDSDSELYKFTNVAMDGGTAIDFGSTQMREEDSNS
jgi:hypothetical protein